MGRMTSGVHPAQVFAMLWIRPNLIGAPLLAIASHLSVPLKHVIASQMAKMLEPRFLAGPLCRLMRIR